MEGSLPRPARSRPLEQPTAPPARRRDDTKRLPLVLALLAALAMTFVLTENRRIERSHFEERTRRGNDDLRGRRIPPVIWQTWRNKPDPATPLGRQVRLLKARNPAHEYHFVDDKAQAAFMRTNFTGEISKAYFSIDPENGAARADLWRYCVLYRYGGWYIDLDVGCRAPLQELHKAGDELAFAYERSVLPKNVPSALSCVAPRTFDANVSRILSQRSFFRRRCIAQNILGSAPGSLPLKAAIDRVVSSLREMKRANEAACLQEYTPSKRDLAKNHSWTWLRTIWLTGPFALTVALRDYVQRHPASSKQMGTFDAHATGCLSSKKVNAAMASERPKYGSLVKERPFVVASS